MSLITGYWSFDGIIIIITSAIVGAYLYMTRNFNYWKERGVDEITPIPFVGNFADCVLMKRSPGEFVRNLYSRSSNLPYLGFYIFDRPVLLVRDPCLIKSILIRDFNYFMDRCVSASSDDILGRANLFIVKNPAWKLIRTKLTPIFTSGKIKKMFELMLEVGKDLDTHLNSLDLKDDGLTLEIKELCAQYATDIIGTTAYGLRVNSLNNPDAEFRRNGREILTFNLWRSVEMTSLFFAPQIVEPMGFKVFTKNSSEFLRRVFWDTIIDREKSGVPRNDLIDLLIELKNNQTEAEKQIFDFADDNLVAQASIFFTAGYETASTTMSFALYELAIAIEVQNKLREEIKEQLDKNGGKITYEMMTTLPYLHMVVSETLRKYPSLPFLDRVATADYNVPNSNLVLKKGIPIYIPMLGLHYDPKYFPNPEVFDPERFSEVNKKELKPFVYLPFGDGPHMCIGMRLGMMETKLGLIHIISNYELSPCKETLIPMKFNPKSFLTIPKGGLYLNVRKLTNSVY